MEAVIAYLRVCTEDTEFMKVMTWAKPGLILPEKMARSHQHP